MTLSIKERFGTELENIVSNDKFNSISVIERGFKSIDSIQKNSILFIGINPSYTDNMPIKNVSYYDLKQKGNDYPQYFSKFEYISEVVGEKWSHLDLLFFRETQQGAIDEIINEQNGLQFIWEQLQVSKKIIEESSPKVIVVCNTKARQFLGKDKSINKNLWLDYDFQFDEEIGTYRLISAIPKLNNVPVFFTSMLTGQRALDNGSFERLVWHIKQVI